MVCLGDPFDLKDSGLDWLESPHLSCRGPPRRGRRVADSLRGTRRDFGGGCLDHRRSFCLGALRPLWEVVARAHKCSALEPVMTRLRSRDFKTNHRAGRITGGWDITAEEDRLGAIEVIDGITKGEIGRMPVFEIE